MASLSPAETASPPAAADRWTAYSVTVWAICMLGFAFDIYEGTIMQLATPLLIKEWGIAPAIVGWTATSYSIAAALPLLALSFFLLVPMFLFVARETTRKELIDFIGQRT